MGQGNSVPRVSGGVPWWLWLVAALATGMVALGIMVQRSTPGADEVWAAAVDNTKHLDANLLKENLKSYRSLGGDADRTNVLEGILAGATNRSPKAISILEPYLEHDDIELRTLATRFAAVAHQRDGNLPRAEELYLAYRELAPDDPVSHLLLMQLYQSAGAVVAAAEAAREVLEIDPSDQSAEQLIAQAYQDTGELTKAIDAYENILDSDAAIAAADPGTLNKYLKCLMLAEKSSSAADFIKQNRVYMNNSVIPVAVFLKNGMTDEANQVLTEIELQQERQDDPRQSGWNIRESLEGIRVKAAQLDESGETEQAIPVLIETVTKYPRSKEVYEQLANMAAEVGDKELEEVCRQNIVKLREIERQIPDAVKRIGNDLKSVDLRLAVARLQSELWNDTEAASWVKAASYIAGTGHQALRDLLMSVGRPKTMLVPFKSESDTAGNETPTPADASGLEQEENASDEDVDTAPEASSIRADKPTTGSTDSGTGSDQE